MSPELSKELHICYHNGRVINERLGQLLNLLKEELLVDEVDVIPQRGRVGTY